MRCPGLYVACPARGPGSSLWEDPTTFCTGASLVRLPRAPWLAPALALGVRASLPRAPWGTGQGGRGGAPADAAREARTPDTQGAACPWAPFGWQAACRGCPLGAPPGGRDARTPDASAGASRAGASGKGGARGHGARGSQREPERGALRGSNLHKGDPNPLLVFI
jgi:hypothetical protein